MIIRAARLTVRICLTLIGILLILLALLSSGVRIGLPLVANYKEHIESRVSDYLHNSVEVGDLSLKWEGLGPLLRAEEVAVFGSDGYQVTLDELLIDLNLAKSLLRGIPIINELTLVGASLAIDAGEDGQFRLRGMESVRSVAKNKAAVSQAGNKGLNIVDWLLNARKVGLLDTQVTLLDQQSNRRLVMENLNIRAENVANEHKLRVDLQLPGELGGRFEAGIDLVGNADSLSNSDGNLYLKADSLQIHTLADVLKSHELAVSIANVVNVADTTLSLELWGQWKAGRLISARGPVQTSIVTNSVTGEVLSNGISASLAFAADESGKQVSATDIVISRGKSHAQIDNVSVQWSNANNSDLSNPDWSMDVSAEQFNATMATRMAESLLSHSHPAVTQSLRQLDARGALLNWQLVVKKPVDATQPTVTLHADLDNLHTAPWQSVPGLGPINGRINIVDSVGEISVVADDMPLPWPVMSDEALSLDSVRGLIGVNITDFQRVLLDGDIELSESGIDLATRLKATIVLGKSPHLDVQSRYSIEDITAVKKWLPTKRLGQGFPSWVDSAILSGSAHNGSLLFFGRVEDFPFDESEGVFRSSVTIKDGKMAFLDNWPVLRDINGTLDLNGLMMTATTEPSRMDSFEISQADVRIDNILSPVIHIEGTAAGQIQKAIDFSNTGPLSSFLEPVLNDVTGSGNVEMDLALTVPMNNPSDVGSSSSAQQETLPTFSVDGSLFLDGNRITSQRAGVALTKVRGAVGFDQNGVRVNNLKGRLLGQPVNIDAITKGTLEAATTYVSLHGALKGSDILAHYKNPLDQFMRGASAWVVELTAPHSAKRFSKEGVRLNIKSDLVGTELRLPVPLSKSSARVQNVELETVFREGEDVVNWDIRLEDQLFARAVINIDELQSMLIHMGKDSPARSALAELAPGIRLQGRAGRVAVDDWTDAIIQLIDSFPVTEGEELLPIMPLSAEFEMGSFELGTQSLGAATLRLSSDETFVHASLDNAFLAGTSSYPRAYWSKDVAAKADIEHLDMVVFDAFDTRPEAPAFKRSSGELDPRLLPPIEARIRRFTQKERTLREVVIRAEPEISGLQFTTVGFAYENMQLVGQGYWRLLDPQGVNPDLAGQHVTRLDLVLQSDNFGEGLSYIGVNDVISDGEGTIEVQLAWPGPVYLPAVDYLDGSMKITLDRGNIIPLEPGAGRIVGLFALQTLPRRLDLDFKDITADGLAFNHITGEATMNNGVVNVDLVQLDGPIGVVEVTGHSDLNAKTFDQNITVLPRVSAALPVIGMISGGASAGIGVLVATGFLKAMGIDLDRLGLREFSLTGPWEKPVFQPVPAGSPRER